MNVVLCGMMGSGKTTVGKELAKALACPCVDTDECIVNRYGDISEIFQSKGEGYFRVLERELVGELAQQDNLVISTGGGLVVNKANVTLLKEKGMLVYLRAKKQTLLSRLQDGEGRPLLEGKGLEEKLTKLLNERESVYEDAADEVVDVDGKTPEEIATEILGRIKK